MYLSYPRGDRAYICVSRARPFIQNIKRTGRLAQHTKCFATSYRMKFSPLKIKQPVMRLSISTRLFEERKGLLPADRLVGSVVRRPSNPNGAAACVVRSKVFVFVEAHTNRRLWRAHVTLAVTSRAALH